MCNVQNNFEQRCSFMNTVMYNFSLLLWIPSMLILFYFYGYCCKIIVTGTVLPRWFICSKWVKNLQKEILFSSTPMIWCDQQRFFWKILLHVLMQIGGWWDFFFFFLNAFQYNKHQTPRISLCGWKSLLAVYPHVFRFKTLKNVTHWVFSPCCFEQNLAMWMPKGGKLWFHLFALYLQLTFSRCVHTVPVFGCNFACKTLSLN